MEKDIVVFLTQSCGSALLSGYCHNPIVVSGLVNGFHISVHRTPYFYQLHECLYTSTY